jgi:secreted trypsin-like serine protease
VPATDYPATAGLRFNGITSGVTCSGTLIAPSWVMTAAHCVKTIGTTEPSKWTAHFGAADLNVAGAGDTYSVVEVHAHPDWNATTLRLGFGDIALLKLGREVTTIAPVALHRSTVPAGTTLSLVGFGRATATPTSADQLSGILRAGENTTIACSSVPFDATRPSILDERSLCFDAESDPGSCERDSGGPAYVGSGATLEVAGVVSGARDTNVGACGKYSIFAAVSRELAFIDSVAGTKPRSTGPSETAAGDAGVDGASNGGAAGGGSKPGVSKAGAAADADPGAEPAKSGSGCDVGPTRSRGPTSLLFVFLATTLVRYARRRARLVSRRR